MNAPTTTAESTALSIAPRQQFDLSPRDFDEAWRMAEYLADSEMVPKDFKGKPANCLVAIQWGAELGLKTMQAIQNIAVINGRPSLWGDVMLALVRASPLCEYVVETVTDQGAVCKVKRRGEPEQSREFTVADATAAGLINKDGPWKQYRKRMLQMRARAWALRDVFTDVLKGLHMAEEAMDMPPEKHMGPADVVGTPPPPPPPAAAALPEFTEDSLSQRLGKITEFYKNGKTADEIIAFYSLKATLPDAMKDRIRGLKTSTNPKDVTDATIKGEPTVSYAQLADRLHASTDAEIAALILDEARALPVDQQKDLSKIYAEKFGSKE